MEEIEVEGTIEKGDRAYTQQDGKRFITNPYGVKKSILAVAEETKQSPCGTEPISQAQCFSIFKKS